MERPAPDWTLIQSFLAVAETGSLTAAAARLGRSQPTLGRHIQALEQDLGAPLFTRHARGQELSETGVQLLPMAREMQVQMNALTLAVSGRSQALSGTVRITASIFASHYYLPPVLARIRTEEPAIELELVPSDSSENLLFRAADIAVRMYRPTQLDIIARHITDLEIGAYAAKSYIARRGRPGTAEELWGHDLVGYDANDLIIRTMRSIGWPAARQSFATRCDNQSTYWQLVRAGCGIGFAVTAAGRDDPLVEELDLGITGKTPALPVWLAAHPAMRQTPRIARVWDILAEELANPAAFL